MIVGEILMYAGQVPPPKTLLCDGRAVSRTTYADLFAVCGTLFGPGDGVTTFNLPDLRDAFPMGDPGLHVGVTGGEATHALSAAEMPSHHHDGGTYVCEATFPIIQSAISAAPGNSALQGVADPLEVWMNGEFDPVVNVSGDTGGGLAHNNLPPFVRLLPCVYSGVP